MSEAADATNVTPESPETAREKLRATIPLLVVGICPLCSTPISRREKGEYRGTVAHRYCSLQEQLNDTNDELRRLREHVFGPIPREAH